MRSIWNAAGVGTNTYENTLLGDKGDDDEDDESGHPTPRTELESGSYVARLLNEKNVAIRLTTRILQYDQ